MIGPLIALVQGAGVPQRFAKWVTIAGVAIASILIMIIGKHLYDRSVIAGATADQRADVATSARNADHAADAADRERAAVRADQSAALQGSIDNASQAQPEAVRRPAGPATNAVLDELRRRQAAAAGHR